MSSKVPIVRQVSREGLLVLALTVLYAFFIGMAVQIAFFPESLEPNAPDTFMPGPNPLVTMLIVYLLVTLVPKWVLLTEFRKAMKNLKAAKYSQAIVHLEETLAFFKRHAWLDKWRFMVLGSQSAISYQEMCLVNIAYCYGQLGEKEKSQQYYERTLELFPKSAIAIAALKMIETFSSNKDG